MNACLKGSGVPLAPNNNNQSDLRHGLITNTLFPYMIQSTYIGSENNSLYYYHCMYCTCMYIHTNLHLMYVCTVDKGELCEYRWIGVRLWNGLWIYLLCTYICVTCTPLFTCDGRYI